MTAAGPRSRVGVAVVNWNDAPATQRCVRSVLECGVAAGDVVVVDNASDARSYAELEKAREAFGFELVRAAENRGFGAGVNIALRQLSTDVVLVLNNDAVLRPGAVAALERALDDNPRAGIAVPLIVTDESRVWFAGGRYRPLVGRPVHSDFGADEESLRGGATRTTGLATGCAMLIRREALVTAGLLNESFFLYWEDLEYSRRVLRAGWEIVLCPDAVVVHPRGQSGDPLRHLSPVMLYYFTRNRLLYLRSFERGLTRATAMLCTPLDVARLLKLVTGLDPGHRRIRVLAVLRGLVDGVRSPPVPVAGPRLEPTGGERR